MHRTMVVSGAPEAIAAIVDEVRGSDDVLAVAVHQGASVKPPGDVAVIDVLNSGADRVLSSLRPAADEGRVTVVLGEATFARARDRQERIEHDADEALWEEIATGLRNHGRLGINTVMLMALGGAIAAVGLVAPPVHQAIAFVAASIVAPGYEPFAKVAFVLTFGRRRNIGSAFGAAAVGYLALVASAMAVMLLLRAVGASDAPALTARFEESLVDFGIGGWMTSACAAVAGGLIVASLRDVYVVGPLIGLLLIPAAALVGAGLAVGQPVLAMRALLRMTLDVVLVVGCAAAVFYVKQKTFHRRQPLA